MASNSVRVAAAQMTSTNNLAANFATCSRLVKEAASAGAKLLCLPESFSYIGAKDGDSVKVAEPLDGPIMKQYCSLARESGIWLSLGGFLERGCDDDDDEQLCNTHVIVDDAGNIRSTYRKIHRFDVDAPVGRMYEESSFTESGKDVVAVDTPVGRLGLTVCYDLRFPQLYQQLRFQHEAQILLVPSAFTKITGEAHWEILLRARAIETQCYVVASAQAGKHNKKRESHGETLIIDPWGTVVGRLPDRTSTGITVADIDFSFIDSVRRKLPIAKACSESASSYFCGPAEKAGGGESLSGTAEKAAPESIRGCIDAVYELEDLVSEEILGELVLFGSQIFMDQTVRKAFVAVREPRLQLEWLQRKQELEHIKRPRKQHRGSLR